MAIKQIFAGCAALLVAYSAQAQDAVVTDLVAGDAISGADGMVLIVKNYDVPPGWATPRHFHSGHVTVYVAQGTARLELESGDHSVAAGEAIQAMPGEAMIMSNASDSERLVFVVHQVNEAGAPYIQPVQ